VFAVKLGAAALISSLVGLSALPALAAPNGPISQQLNTPPAIPGGVPEPATWAMMLIGIALLGVAVRVRRRAVG
jgi:hypothetical protein